MKGKPAHELENDSVKNIIIVCNYEIRYNRYSI
jgi:hypothetical protein